MLSARDESRLRQRTQDLLDWLDRQGPADVDLQRVAYTLQVGRDAMDERLAFIAHSPVALTEHLRAFIDDQPSRRPGSQFRGNAALHREALAPLADEAMRWVQAGQHDKLLGSWARGLDVDWDSVLGERPRQRVSLPGYPFSKARFWPRGSSVLPPMPAGPPDARAKAGAARAAAGLPHLQQSLLSVLAATTGHEADEILVIDSFDALGVDSLARIAFVSKVIKNHPELEPAGQSLLEADSFSELSRVVDARWPGASSGAPDQEDVLLDELALDLKKSPLDVLCRSIRVLQEDPFAVNATLVVDEDHPFFFDHPLDHVSGLHLAEAMKQACLVAEQRRSGASAHGQARLVRMRIAFERFCKKDEAATLHAVLSGERVRESYEVRIHQLGQLVATGSVELGPLAPWTQTSVPEGAVAAACDQALANKRRIENVYVTPLTDQEGDGLSCGMLASAAQGPFGDTRQPGGLDLLAVAEACRQAHRQHVVAAATSSDGDAAGELMGILKQFEIEALGDLDANGPLRIRMEEDSTTAVGTTRLQICRLGVYGVDGSRVAACRTTILLLDNHVYRSWRDDGITAKVGVESASRSPA